MTFTLGQLARYCGAEQPGDPLLAISGVSTDTRSIVPGALFVALVGENFDGHDFAEAAVGAGAAALCVSRALDLDVPQLLVSDTERALGDLAQGHRAAFQGPVIAIAGSNGKTTTKEMVAGIFDAAGVRTRKTEGNLNNLIGLPLSVLPLADSDEVLVVEMGMNQPGEIDRLAEIAAPTVGTITNVAPAHLGPMGSIEAIARAKGELFERMAGDGTIVVNADDARCVAQSARFAGRQLTFGRAAGADFRAADVSNGACASFDLHAPLGPVHIALTAPGPHLFENALCAAACAFASGLLGDDALDTMRRGLESFRGVRGRLAICRTGDGRTVIDDSYNSNPHSVAAALRTLAELRGDGRAVAVLGDMLELGPDEAALHAEMGRLAARSGVRVLVTVGERSAHTCAAAREAGLEESYSAADVAEAIELLAVRVTPGDVVLVKGSRGMRLERVVDALVGAA